MDVRRNRQQRGSGEASAPASEGGANRAGDDVPDTRNALSIPVVIALALSLLLCGYSVASAWTKLVLHNETRAERISDAIFLAGMPALVVFLILSIRHQRAWQQLTQRFDNLRKVIERKPVAITLACPLCDERISLDEAEEHINQHIDNHTDPSHASKPLAAIYRNPGDDKWSVLFQENP